MIGLLAWVVALGGVKNRPLAEFLLFGAAAYAAGLLLSYPWIRRLVGGSKVAAWFAILGAICLLWIVARNNLLPEEEPPLIEQIAEVVEESVEKAIAGSVETNVRPPAQEPAPTTALPTTSAPVVAPPPPQPIERKREEPPPVVEPPPADVSLRFIQPQSLAVLVRNSGSSGVVREARYAVVLWNLDAGEEPPILPVPTRGFSRGDWIRPNNSLGPERIAALPNVQSQLKQGNRLLGYAQVSCPDCLRDRAYWLYVVHGESGWYSEIEAGYPDLHTLNQAMPEIRKNTEIFFRNVPVESRIPIERDW